MLAAMRQKRFIKIANILFGFMAFLMVATPIMSLFQRSSSNNPVIMRSEHRALVMSDLIGRDRGMLFQTLMANSKKSTQQLTEIVNQYLKSFVYEDIRQQYDLNISDRLAWNLFISQLGHDLSESQYLAINEAIAKNFSSRAQFLSEFKTQLVMQSWQNTIARLMKPVNEVKGASDYEVRRYLTQYSFSPRDFHSEVEQPAEEVLLAFYRNHSDRYYSDPTYSMQVVLIEPRLINLESIAQDLKSEAYAQLSAIQNQNDDAQLPASSFELQDRIVAKLLLDAQSKEISTLAELNDFLVQQGVVCDSEHVFNFDRASEQTITEFFTDLPEAYSNIQMQVENQNMYRSALGSNLVFMPSDRGFWVVDITNYEPESLLDYTRVRTRVLHDCVEELSALAAKDAAKAAYDRYIQTGEKPLGALVSKAHYISDRVLYDQRFPEEVRLKAAGLVSAEYLPEESIALITQAADEGARIIILDKIEPIQPELNPASQQLGQSAHDVNWHEMAYQKAAIQGLDNWFNASFHYQIEPAFWEIVTPALQRADAL